MGRSWLRNEFCKAYGLFYDDDDEIRTSKQTWTHGWVGGWTETDGVVPVDDMLKPTMADD